MLIRATPPSGTHDVRHGADRLRGGEYERRGRAGRSIALHLRDVPKDLYEGLVEKCRKMLHCRRGR